MRTHVRIAIGTSSLYGLEIGRGRNFQFPFSDKSQPTVDHHPGGHTRPDIRHGRNRALRYRICS